MSVLWIVFAIAVLTLLALDLGVFHRTAHVVTFREAIVWSGVWIGLAGAFGVAIHILHGQTAALEFATAYLVEKTLSVDNVLIFVVLFGSLGIPPAQQHRVLFWGVVTAILLRAVFVAAGATLIASFHAVIYVFGAILVVTGTRIFLQRDQQPEPERNLLYRAFCRLIPVSRERVVDRFFVRADGRWVGTTLLLALVAAEATDIVFAIDSIPAVFAITKDPFVIYTSNVFAILGLRSLFFVVAGALTKLRHLKVGLALTLVFVGAKMLLSDVVHVPAEVSLLAIGMILGTSILTSLRAVTVVEPPPVARETAMVDL